jgi:hypothetical protein
MVLTCRLCGQAMECHTVEDLKLLNDGHDCDKDTLAAHVRDLEDRLEKAEQDAAQLRWFRDRVTELVVPWIPALIPAEGFRELVEQLKRALDQVGAFDFGERP